jgi:hypothetical protein
MTLPSSTDTHNSTTNYYSRSVCACARALQCESAQKARKNVRTPEPAIDGVDNLDGGSIQKLI